MEQFKDFQWMDDICRQLHEKEAQKHSNSENLKDVTHNIEYT